MNDSYPKYVTDNPQHEEAAKFLLDCEPKDGVAYEWIWEYAQNLWNHRFKIFTDLDGKADNIIKYLGGGIGLFALGLLAKIDTTNWWIALAALPAVFSGIAAVVCAVIVRKPGFAPSPPTVKETLRDYVEPRPKEQESKATFLGQWNLACVHMNLVCRRKADWLGLATWLYISAIALLLIPIGAAIYFAAK